MLTSLAGIRPDVPAGPSRCARPPAPRWGALQFTGLSVAEQPFVVRTARLGTGMVEAAADGLQLGS